MALNLADYGCYEEALLLTDDIEHRCTNEGVLTKLWETRANAYIRAEEYDSAIYCVSQLQSRGNYEPTGYLLAAQAYSWLGQNDSALFYARKTMEVSSYHGDKFNVLYILSHCDSTLSMEDVLSLTSEREDLRYYEYEPMKESLIQAIQLLQQDLSRKPDLRWLFAILITLTSIGIPGAVYIFRKRKKHQLVSQQTEALSQYNQQLKREQSKHTNRALAEIEFFCKSITKDNIKQELCWKEFDQMCAIVNRRMYGLIDKLKLRGIKSETEIRICVVVAIGNFDTKQMIDIVSSSYDSFKTTKSLAAKKLKTSGKNMHSALINLAVGS